MSYPDPRNGHVNWKKLFLAWLTIVAVLFAVWMAVRITCRPPATQAVTQAVVQVAPIDQTTTRTYRQPPWTYKHYRATRSSGQQGVLLYKDHDCSVTSMEIRPFLFVNDYYETPWGLLYWHGRPGIRWLPHGWMPFPTWREGPGVLLPTPVIDTP